MRWWKKMSRTDAQQPTKGRVVPYMRFIKGKNPHKNQEWFRKTFFAGQAWHQDLFGQHPVEQCTVPFEVTIAGVSKGIRNFLITHDDMRMNNNNTPNTWLHYDQATLNDLSKMNATGKIFSVEKVGNTYKLNIT